MVSYKALNTVVKCLISSAGNAVRNDNIKQRTQPLNADSANMANQLILLRTKQKDAEVIMQTLFSSKAP